MSRTRIARGYPHALVDGLLSRLLARLGRRGRPLWIVGLSGAQGSGTSTLAAQLARAAAARGIPARSLALDDFYLGRADRRELARRVHPLFATRGVPGMHAVGRLCDTLDALRARAVPLALPRFDEGRDTRQPPSREPRLRHAPDLILLEGWCVGVPPQPARALVRPGNALERREDPEGRWRRAVDAALVGPYADLWARLDARVLLQAPGWSAVARWRDEAERPRRAAGAPRALTPAALRRFLQHFERLARHIARTLPSRADLLVRLDPARRPRAVRLRRPPPAGAGVR